MKITYGLATSPGQVNEATALVTAVYQKAGYVREGESSGISAFLTSPATVTFTASIEEKMVGTISVVADSSTGLPMDSIFKGELALFRAQGIKIAEVGQFAIDQERLPGDRAASLALFKFAFHYGLRKGFDLFCITVNPKHEAFYQAMGFQIFAETRDYPSVENAPAVPMKLDLAKLRTQGIASMPANALFTEIFNNPPEESVLIQALAKAVSPNRQQYLVP